MASYDRFPLQGGLDTSTPYLSRQPGTLNACTNFSPETDGGYAMNNGYERYDGRPAPSEVIIYNVQLNQAPTGTLLVGSTFTFSPSGATGIIGRIPSATSLWVDILNGVDINPGDTFNGATVQYVTTEAIDARSYDATATRTNELAVVAVTTNTLQPGDTLLGLTSSSTVLVNAVVVTVSDIRVFCTFLNGQPQNGETLHKVDGTDYHLNFQYDLEPMLSNPTSPASVFFYLSELRRSKIGEVPGVNPVRGVWDLEGIRYTVRDANALNAVMYRSSPTGWQAVALGFTLNWNSRPTTVFDADVVIGHTVKGATSGAQGVIGWSGYIAQDHSTGYFSFKTLTGTFVAGENLTDLNNGLLIGKAAAPSAVNTLPTGGTYKFVNHNFTGGQNTFAMYGVNGVSNGFVYSETNGFSFIPTAADDDRPFDVCEYKDHLFFALPMAQLQHSVVGAPLDWSGGLGALNVGVGSEISSLIPSPKSLIICTEKDIQSLQGDGYDSWVKQVITQHTGISKFTGMYQSQSFVLAQAGIVSLDRTGNFGDFSDAIISDTIRDILVPNYAHCTGALARKSRGQYRLFFEGDLNVNLSTNQGNIIGFSTFDYGGLTVRQAVNPYGQIYFVSDTGFVYRDEVGASNDGAERASTWRSSFAMQGDPDTRKRYRRMDMNVRSASFVNCRVVFTYNKGSATPGSAIQSGLITSGGGRWDLSLWNNVYWDATESPTISSEIDGIAFDISTLIYVSSRIHPPFTCEDLSFEWSPRRKVR